VGVEKIYSKGSSYGIESFETKHKDVSIDLCMMHALNFSSELRNRINLAGS
jgi:hypothetical protein